jgi:hypothetical protein
MLALDDDADARLFTRLAAASEGQVRVGDGGTSAATAPLPEAAWWTAPELVSAHGTPLWESLDEATRRRLSFWEAVAFFSLNVHNEGHLVAGVRARRGRFAGGALGRALCAYLDHFVREEEAHARMFTRFCVDHAGGVLPDRVLAPVVVLGPSDVADGDDFTFFARVLLFEEIVDAFNRALARDVRLPEAVRAVHRQHHRDEARHLRFGRALTQRLWQSRPAGIDTGDAADALGDYLAALGRGLVSVDAYRRAGVAQPFVARQLVLASAAHRQRVTDAAAGAQRFFAALGLAVDLPREPAVNA